MMLPNLKNPGLLLLMSMMTCLLVLVACGSSSTTPEDAQPAATKAPSAPKIAATATPKIVREASTPVPKAEKWVRCESEAGRYSPGWTEGIRYIPRSSQVGR